MSCVQVNIFALEYSGYGASTGEPSVANTIADIEAGYRYLTDDMGVNPPPSARAADAIPCLTPTRTLTPSPCRPSRGGRPLLSTAWSLCLVGLTPRPRSQVPAKNIVLYGQSVGSGPVCNLAARVPLRGVVLHCALMTGLQTIFGPPTCCSPSCTFAPCDIYRNIELVQEIEAKKKEKKRKLVGFAMREANPQAL